MNSWPEFSQYAVDYPTFPDNAILAGMLSRKDEPSDIWDSMVCRETFLQILMRLHQHLIPKNCINGIHRLKSRSIRPQWRKMKGQNKIEI